MRWRIVKINALDTAVVLVHMRFRDDRMNVDTFKIPLQEVF